MPVAWYSKQERRYHIYLNCHGDDEILTTNFECGDLATISQFRILCLFCFTLSLDNEGECADDCQEAWKKYNSQCGESADTSP